MDMKINIPTELFDVTALTRVIENQLDMSAEAAKIDFDVTASTWNDKPEFAILKDIGIRTIVTYHKVYFFLNYGTRVRYVTMTRNFRPKSRAGYIGANKGSGSVLYLSKRRPRPGIKAREWDKAIAKKWDKEFPTQMQRAIDAEASRQMRRR